MPVSCGKLAVCACENRRVGETHQEAPPPLEWWVSPYLRSSGRHVGRVLISATLVAGIAEWPALRRRESRTPFAVRAAASRRPRGPPRILPSPGPTSACVRGAARYWRDGRQRRFCAG